jgi:SAM-dependent methyltransferase
MSGEPVFRRRAIEWTPEAVQRFWDWFGSNPALTHLYFSLKYGDSLLEQTSRVIPLRGRLLDVGCGPGHLVEKALDRGLQAVGVDSSAGSVEALRQRLGGRPGFLGAHVSQGLRVPLPDGSADIVTVIETVEHLDDPTLAALVREAARLAAPGGHVVVTTPNQENLPELETMCPSCGCVFHQYQHVRSFTPDALRAHMEAAGLVTVSCRPVLFSALPRWARPLERLAYPRLKGKLPHMLYVGRRP